MTDDDTQLRSTGSSAAASPRRVVTIGLHGSASTWVFNVARELLENAFCPDAVRALYAEEVEALLPEPESGCLLVKSHHGSPSLDRWIAETQPTLILSIRDPRDAAISMALRFRVPLELTVGWLKQDCARLLRLAPLGGVLFRYEDRFFENCAALHRIAEILGLAPAPLESEAIFRRYEVEAVRRFTAELDRLPSDRPDHA